MLLRSQNKMGTETSTLWVWRRGAPSDPTFPATRRYKGLHLKGSGWVKTNVNHFPPSEFSVSPPRVQVPENLDQGLHSRAHATLHRNMRERASARLLLGSLTLHYLFIDYLLPSLQLVNGNMCADTCFTRTLHTLTCIDGDRMLRMCALSGEPR